MRILSKYSLFFILTINTCFAQTKIVNRPDFENSNTESFEIEKLELKPSETILYCNFYGKKTDLVSLSAKSYLKGKSGKIYNITGSNGIEFDKKISFPISGIISFKLTAEAIDSTENSFDFIEGNEQGDFRISGLKIQKASPQKKKIRCLLKGETVNRPYSSRLILIKGGEHPTQSTRINIPIINGKFEYELNCDNIEAYEFIFHDEIRNSQWRSVEFFAEQGEVNFKLYPMTENFKNEIKGGKVNNEYCRYLTLKDSLFHTSALRELENELNRTGKYYSDKATRLFKEKELTNDKNTLDSLNTLLNKLYESGDLLSIEATNMENESHKMSEKSIDWSLDFIRQRSSLVNYYLLLKNMDIAAHYTQNLPICVDIYRSKYANKYPQHPFEKKMSNLVNSYLSIKIGGLYIDFVAPDLSGKIIRLSERIKGKVALVDLWASWCGPCRRNSKSLIPVYENYKNKGLVIVGIARESNAEDAISAVKKDKYPWLNLIELHDKENIWDKYNLSRSGGGTFLVDRKGVILAIDPTVEQITKILDEQLK